MGAVSELHRPDYVAADKVVDFDFFRDLTSEEPHELIAELAANHPVFWTPRNSGHWVIAGHPEMFEAVRNVEIFSSESGPLPRSDIQFKQVPIFSDPPEHGLYREPLARAFSPKAMMALQPSIREMAVQLIEAVRQQGHCDFAAAVAEPLPVSIFMKLMGLPLDNLPQYRKWVHEYLISGDEEIRNRASAEVIEAMTVIVRERMVERKDDLISKLLDTSFDGRAITLEEMQSYCLLLFIAGLDTVMNAICYGVRHLARNPDLQAELRANPARITDAMEEMLRRYTFTTPTRDISRDYDAFGVHFKKGDRVLLLLPAVDLDPREFPEPKAFNLDRENKVHMAFNSGPHRCVGSHLARIELRIVYEELLARLPEFRLDPDNRPVINGGFVIGFTSLPLVWNPA